jgi:phosphatidylglycerol---prolipoprotein diacylglyceryl transferase
MMQFFDPAVAFNLGPLTVRWYGIIICLGMALGIVLAMREAKRQHQDEEHLLNMLLLVIPLAVLGSRLYYVIFNLDWYLAHPVDILASWKGGLAIHGAVITGILVLIIYSRIKKLDFFRWADILVPSLILGQAIGRWGNFANQEAYGPVIGDGSFWSWVPLQVYADGAYHHPTFLYESICDFALFIFLMILIRRPHRIGAVFSWYLIIYSVARFFIEGLRQDSLMLGPLRTAQIVSLLGIAAGIIILYFLRRRPKLDVAAPLDGSPSAAQAAKNKKAAAKSQRRQ